MYEDGDCARRETEKHGIASWREGIGVADQTQGLELLPYSRRLSPVSARLSGMASRLNVQTQKLGIAFTVRHQVT